MVHFSSAPSFHSLALVAAAAGAAATTTTTTTTTLLSLSPTPNTAKSKPVQLRRHVCGASGCGGRHRGAVIESNLQDYCLPL